MTRSSRYQTGRVALALLAMAALMLVINRAEAKGAELNTYVTAGHFGREVNEEKTKQFNEPGNPDKVLEAEENICSVSEKCQPGSISGEKGEGTPAGFFFPESLAVGKNENIYIADQGNNRIQELDREGNFILMFGWDVNKTKVAANAAQTERDICTAASKDECQSGSRIPTGLAEQLFAPKDVAVDPGTGNVYVLDRFHRIDEYTESGAFVVTFGREVNKTKVEASASKTEQDVCTAVSGDQCQSGVGTENGQVEGEVKPAPVGGNLLSFGGSEGLLYEADYGRVQKFGTDGELKGEITLMAPMNGELGGLAVDPTGDMFVARRTEGSEPGTGVHEYGPKGEQQVVIDKNAAVVAMAWDPHGRLGVIEREAQVAIPAGLYRGLLFDPNGNIISEFNPPRGVMEASGPKGLAFSASGTLYIAQTGFQEIEKYMLGLFPGARTCPAEAVGATTAMLCGEVNPDSLSTKAYFLYESLATTTTSETQIAFEGSEEAFTPMSWQLTGLVPDETYRYRVVAQAKFEGKAESVTSERGSFTTGLLAPETEAAVRASYLTYESALLEGSVNPEHAPTRYHFKYGPCSKLVGCASAKTTPEEESSQYGAAGVAQQAGELSPDTTYVYQLVASNEAGESVSSEGKFTTAPPPAPSVATGAAAAISATGAVISGTVDPGGAAATYTFSLGVYEGTATHLGIVFSGSTPAISTALAAECQLSGLQPGITYAYRIAAASGYGSAEGAIATFTTPGLPAVLASPEPLAMLPTPSIAFPKAPKATKQKPSKKHASKKQKKKRKGSAKKNVSHRR